MGWFRVKQLTVITALVLLLACIASASAFLSLDSPSNVKLGSDSAKGGTTLTSSFEIKNSGNETITNLGQSITADIRFNLQASGLPSSLAPNQSATITLSATLPNGFSGTSTIGNIKLTSAQLNRTVTVDLQGRNPLSIKKIRFDIAGNGDTVSDGDSVDIKARPGDDVKITVEFENLYDRQDEDLDINDIDATITARDIDDGDDFDTDDSFDLNAEEKQSMTLSFKIPIDADEDTYSVDIDADGVDDNGNSVRVSATVDYEVQKESHALKITKFTVAPSTASCSPRTITLGVELTNYGRNDEDQVSYGIRQPVLGMEINQFDISLTNDLSETDSKYRRDVRFAIPDSINPGTYQIELTAFTDNNFAAFQVADVVVSACQDTVTPPPAVTPPTTAPPVVTPLVDTTNGATGATTAQSGASDQNMTLIIALAAINIVLIVAVIAVASKMMSK